MVNLVVEDGTGLENANSYISVADFRQFALENGIDLESEEDEQLAVYLIRSTNFIDSVEYRFVGTRLSVTQSLAFPRVKKCNRLHLYDMRNLRKAICFAVEVLVKGESLVPTKLNKEDFVKTEQLDVLKVQYSEEYFKNVSGYDVLSNYPMIANNLRGYLKQANFNPTVGR